MKRFVEGEDRLQGALLPHCLDDYVTAGESTSDVRFDFGIRAWF
jgi:hypothetical protein